MIVPFVPHSMPTSHVEEVVQESIGKALTIQWREENQANGVAVSFKKAPMILIKIEFLPYYFVAQYINGKRVQYNQNSKKIPIIEAESMGIDRLLQIAPLLKAILYQKGIGNNAFASPIINPNNKEDENVIIRHCRYTEILDSHTAYNEASSNVIVAGILNTTRKVSVTNLQTKSKK